MRKLNILKTIVDIVWIISVFSVPLILFSVIFLFLSEDTGNLKIKIIGLQINETTIFTKLTLGVLFLIYLLLIYCIYLFKKILRCFQRLKMFDELVIVNFNKIGYLLIISSLISGTLSFIYKLFYAKTIHLEIGVNSFLVMLCLGFFFMVLSEIFKISKNMKEESDLTI